jgi:transposase-like protein
MTDTKISTEGRNALIVNTKRDGHTVAEIATEFEISASTVRRVLREAEAARELEALEAAATASPASKAKATKAAKAKAQRDAQDAEFEGTPAPEPTLSKAAPKAKAKGSPVAKMPGSGVLVDGEVYIRWTRKTRDGDVLTVANPQAIGADPSEGKWVTFCEKHNTLVYSDTQKLARETRGIDFCDDCRAEADLATSSEVEAAAERATTRIASTKARQRKGASA